MPSSRRSYLTAPVEPHAPPRHVGEAEYRCGCDRLIAGAFERGLRSLGIHLRLVTERLGSSVDGPAVEASEIFPAERRRRVITLNGGGGLFLVGSRFGVAGNHADMLLNLLLPIVYISEQPEQAALRWSVEQITKELRDWQPGNALVVQHLAHLMLVQALRVHLDTGSGDRAGWFRSGGQARRGLLNDP
jgi:hypothetical protein